MFIRLVPAPSTPRSPAVGSGGITQTRVEQAAELAIAMQRAGEPRAMPADYQDTNVSVKVVKLIQSYTPIVNETIWLKRCDMISDTSRAQSWLLLAWG